MKTEMQSFLLLFATLVGFTNSLKVSIYYESQCPDSVRFIKNQLFPNYAKYFSSVLELDFVPYGKATHTLVNGTWEFECQHGPEECYGNKYQACALAQANGQDNDAAYVNCVMSQSNPAAYTSLVTCATSVGIDFSPIEECFSKNGDELLAKYGDQTHAVEPTITFVPTIVFDDVYNQDLQDKSLTDFAGAVCSQLNSTSSSICSSQESLKVSVYYESLCPYSMRFIINELYPNYVNHFNSILELDFVPYGKANHTYVDGSWEFVCQHGERECYGNKYQACALAQDNGEEKNAAYINCVMGDSDPASYTALYRCAANVGIDFSLIEECFLNEGDELLVKYGNQTHSVQPTITRVPTIIFNDVYNESLHNQSVSDFANAVCSQLNYLPAICTEVNLGVMVKISLQILGICLLFAALSTAW